MVLCRLGFGGDVCGRVMVMCLFGGSVLVFVFLVLMLWWRFLLMVLCFVWLCIDQDQSRLILISYSASDVFITCIMLWAIMW